MSKISNRLYAVWHLYRDGFKNMTWGKPLWLLIFLKLFIMFAILRVFFFRPAMSGMTEEEKSETVGTHLTKENINHQRTTLNY